MKTRLSDPDFDVDTFRDDRGVTPTVQIPGRMDRIVLPWQRDGRVDDDRNCIIERGTKVHICETHAVFLEWERETYD